MALPRRMTIELQLLETLSSGSIRTEGDYISCLQFEQRMTTGVGRAVDEIPRLSRVTEEHGDR